MKLLKAAAALALFSAAAWFGLRGQLAYAKTIGELSRLEGVVVPVESLTLDLLAKAVDEGRSVRDLPPPVFGYVEAELEGRRVKARAAYAEKLAPPGGVMSMTVIGFLRSAVDDPAAEAAVFNPGAPAGAFTATLDKAAARSAIDSLRRRGLPE